MPYSEGIHYRIAGQNSENQAVLILIHGAGGSSLYWPPEIRRLPGRRVMAIDLPGHGASSGGAEETIEAYAERVKEFLDRLQIDQAVLCGHSMGSAVVQRLSLDHAERVAGLVLVGGGAKLQVNPQLIEDCSRPETFPQALVQILEWSFSPQADRKLVELAGARMEEVSPAVLLADFAACNAFNILDEVEEIEQPALIICGGDDQMTPVKFSSYLAENIKDSKLEVIPGAGHMVMLEKAQVVAELMVNFLDGIEP
jgi:pimeloyl-ACP methyl ester carboxylesterase